MRLTLTAALIVTLSALTVFGCAHSQLTTDELFEPGEGRVVVSLPELSCITCGNKVANKLKELPGVSQVAFSKAKVEIGVAFNAEEVSTETILEVSNSVGEKAVLGAGRGNYAPPVAHAKETDTIVISRGEEVTLSEHMALGKVTVVEFYANWCGPCRRVAIILNAIVSDRDDVAVRKIDIVEWDTPVAQQHMQSVSELPYTVVFDKTGKEVRRITGLDIPGLHAAIEEASK